MSRVGACATLELSTALNAAAPAPKRHASDSDALPTPYLSSSRSAETTITGAEWARSKPSGSVAAAAAAFAAVALTPHHHPLSSKRAAKHSSLTLGSEAEQSPDNDSLFLPANEGMPLPFTPLSLMSRRATLPFAADATNHSGGGVRTSEGAFRFAFPTLVGTTEAVSAQDSTSCATDARAAFVPEMEPGDAHQQPVLDRPDSPRHATVFKDAAEDVPAAERGMLSLSGSLISASGAVRHAGGARQAEDVTCTTCSSINAAFTPLTTVGMPHAERYFSSLCGKWRPEALFSADSEAASSSSLCMCAVGNDVDSSPPSCRCSCLTSLPNRNSASHLLSTTLPPTAAPLGASAAASAQLMHQRFFLPSPGAACSAKTIPTTAAAISTTTHAEDVKHLCGSFPDAGRGADALLRTNQEGVQADDECALDISGGAAAAISIPAGTPCTSHNALPGKRDGGIGNERVAPSPGILGAGVGGSTERGVSLSLTPPDALVEPKMLRLTGAIVEVCTSSSATGTASKSAQHSSPAMQPQGWCKGRRRATATLLATRALHQHGSGSTTTTAYKLGTLLEFGEDPQGHQRAFLPCFTRGAACCVGKDGLPPVSGRPHAAATDAPSTLSPFSSSWPPLDRARRCGTAATPARAESPSEEEAKVHRPGTPDEEAIITLLSAQSPRSVRGEVEGTIEGCRELFDTVLTAPATLRSPIVQISSGSSGDAAADSVTPPCALLLPFLQSQMSRWLRWVNHKYRGVALHSFGEAGEERLLQRLPTDSLPKGGCAFPMRPNDDSSRCRPFFPFEDSPKADVPGNAAFYDVHRLEGDMPCLSLALSLSGSLVDSSNEGERSRGIGHREALSSLTSPWSAAGNNSWVSVGLQTEQREMVCATGELMQLRSSLTAPPPLSSMSRDALLPASSGERRCASPASPSPPLSTESLTASQIFSGSAPQWLSSDLVGVLNSSASFTCPSGDYRVPSLHSSLSCRSCLGGSTASTVADDRHREALYRLFHQPPSSLIGNLSECHDAYQAMVGTFSKEHHGLSWGELGPLLRPEDFIDYRALFPPQHLITFGDFVEFVEVLSVRYRR
ncbi:hypothetical protein LSCM1_00423 [Leishmania martiniquensis]|uniref:Uncharacterized protein n=1 Tax=Leishmania martiniquensis TaxID=1580590 RepID=A0A836K9U4_9TRYP|nr:hypothetical protein LSCM1_00423 [Leishmania martiniquensis]